MSEENAVQEEAPNVGTSGAEIPSAPEDTLSATPVAEVGGNVSLEPSPYLTDAVKSYADDLSAKIAALEPAAQAVLTEVINHIADGFINVSVPVGFLRIEKLLG